MGLVKAAAEREGARRRGRACPVSLVDKTSLRRGHRYVTVVADREANQTLGMLPGWPGSSGIKAPPGEGAWR